MKEQNLDYLAIIRADNEGMVLKNVDKPQKILAPEIKYDILANEAATNEGMPEPQRKATLSRNFR